MASDSFKVKNSLNIEPKGLPASPADGDIMVDSGDSNKFKIRDNGTTREVTTNDGTQTLTNKTLTSPTVTGAALDDTTTIDDASDATKQIGFDAGGTGSTKTTIAAAQTANRTVTLPDATDTLVGKATTDTLTNKTLGDTNTINAQDDAFTIQDAADATLEIDFNAAGTTGTKTTITGSQTSNRTITLPDATDTLMGKATTDTMTNKTFDVDGAGNNISNVANGNIKVNFYGS